VKILLLASAMCFTINFK